MVWKLCARNRRKTKNIFLILNHDIPASIWFGFKNLRCPRMLFTAHSFQGTFPAPAGKLHTAHPSGWRLDHTEHPAQASRNLHASLHPDFPILLPGMPFLCSWLGFTCLKKQLKSYPLPHPQKSFLYLTAMCPPSLVCLLQNNC